MRRFPRVRALVTGFAVIALVSAVLAGGTRPAYAAPATIIVPSGGSFVPSTADGTFTYTYPQIRVAAEQPADDEPETPTCTASGAGTVGPVGLTKSTFKLGKTTVTCTTTEDVTPAEPADSGTFTVIVKDEKTVVTGPGLATGVSTDATDQAFVSYPTAVTASEPSSGEQETSPTCTATGATTNASVGLTGDTFNVGVTTVTCNATDSLDGTTPPGTTATPWIFQVTVADQQVILTVPPTQLAQATSSSGAAVSYGPVTAAEGSEAGETGLSCSADKPAATPFPGDGFVSGGNFPIGGTTLTCTAQDLVDGFSGPPPPSPQSFTVIITKTPCAALAGCNLRGLDLSNAILAGADLSSGTDLSNANLNKADLSGANLSYANLSGANLNQADLTGANLTGANLTGANLTNAKLDGVIWSNTTCPDGTNSSASTPETCVAVPATMTIGNTPAWTQASGITSGFGYGTCCSATYGQTVTVPSTDNALDSFTFYVDLPTTLTFRGEVYAWNNTLQHATGNALYESGQMHTTSYHSGFGPYEAITFNTGGLPLTAGAQYVLFFTISKDYAANAGITATGFVGVTTADTYSGGNWVFINNACTTGDCGGDTSLWTTTPWSNNVGVSNGAQDLGFTATFSSHKNPPSGP